MLRQALDGVPWVARVRRGTLDEDRRGLDVVVETHDTEDLYVQVKSSHAGAVAYRRKYSAAATFSCTLLLVLVTGRAHDFLIPKARVELLRLHRAHGGRLPDVPSPKPAHALVGNSDGAVNARRRALAAGDTSPWDKSSPAQLADMAKLQTIALERERLKTERCLAVA